MNRSSDRAKMEQIELGRADRRAGFGDLRREDDIVDAGIADPSLQLDFGRWQAKDDRLEGAGSEMVEHLGK